MLNLKRLEDILKMVDTLNGHTKGYIDFSVTATHSPYGPNYRLRQFERHDCRSKTLYNGDQIEVLAAVLCSLNKIAIAVNRTFK